jgi:hypothetical protein
MGIENDDFYEQNDEDNLNQMNFNKMKKRRLDENV